MTELKPCPFCGGEAEAYKKYFANNKPSYVYVRCKNCKASTTNFFYEKNAFMAWNKRPEEFDEDLIQHVGYSPRECGREQ